MAFNITLGTRIILHLSTFDALSAAYETPPDVTQQGIAELLAVRQSDVSRALSRLKAEGIVEEKVSSVSPCRTGRKQRLKVYFLSQRGQEASRSILSRLSETMVTLSPRPDGTGPRRAKLGDVNTLLGTNHPLSKLVEMVFPDGTLVSDRNKPFAGDAASPPAARTDFIGRSRELSELGSKIRDGPEVMMAVIGIPGVGKTTFAHRLISEMRDRRPFYYRIREWASFRPFLNSLREFACKFGRKRLAAVLQKPGPPSMDEILEAVLKDLDGLMAVIMLDDFHEAAGQPELRQFVTDIVEVLNRTTPPTRLLLFTRTAPDLFDRRHVIVGKLVGEYRLEGLDEKSSRELATRSGVDTSEFETIFKITRGHPLSIKLSSGAQGSRNTDAKRFLQEEVIGRIPQAERTLLQSMSALRRTEELETIMALSDDPLAYDALSALVSRSLVSSAMGKFEVHEMVREGAYGRMPAPNRKLVHSRAASHYLKSESADGRAEAVYHFSRAGEHERAAQLLLSLGGELIEDGKLEECRALLDIAEPRAEGAPAEGLRRLRDDLLGEYGDWDFGYEYLFQMGILHPVLGMTVPAPGQSLRSAKEWALARSDHERSLAVLEKTGDRAGACEMMCSLGWLHLMLGDNQKAAKVFGQVLDYAKDKECREVVLRALAGTGHAAFFGKNSPDDPKKYNSALKMARRREDIPYRIQLLNFLANSHQSARDDLMALRQLEQALGLCGTGRHRRERAYTLLHLGRVKLKLDMRAEAERNFVAALNEFTGIGDTSGMAYCGLSLALSRLGARDFPGASQWANNAAALPSPELAAVREIAAKIGEKVRTTDPLAGDRFSGGAP